MRTAAVAAPEICIVGAGPGHPDLITIAGLRALQQAEVVLHDALIDLAGFQTLAPSACWIAVGKRSARPSPHQGFINRLLLSHVRRGSKVVRLKGGDAAVFGRLGEEIAALEEAGVRVRIIPGVTAASAAAAELAISLTQRAVARSVTFITPASAGPQAATGQRRAARPWAQAAVHADTTVLYMAGRERVAVAKALLEEGLHPETPVGIVAGASLDTQAMVTTLSAMALGGVEFSDQPVCLLVGEVLRARLEAQRAGTCGQRAPSVGAG